MRNILFLVLVLSVFVAVNVSAEGQVSLWGGYTAVNMKDLNDRLDVIEQVATITGVNYLEKSKIRDAFIIGADYLFDIDENVKVGPRVAFLQTNKGKIGGGGGGESIVVNTSLVPIMVGGCCNKNINEKFSLNWKLFFGCGLVKYESTLSAITWSGNEIKVSNTEDKSCFVANVSIGAQCSFTKRFGLGFDLGYRYTSMTKLKLIDLDFSGLTTTLSLSYKI